MKRDVIQYLAGRFIPAFVNLSIIVLSIHYYGSTAYGSYSLLYYTALMCITLSFHGVQVSIVRFLSAMPKASEIAVSRFFFLTIFSTLGAMILIGFLGFVFFHLSWPMITLLVIFTFLSHFYLYHLANLQAYHRTTRVAVLEGTNQMLVLIIFLTGFFLFHWNLTNLLFVSYIAGLTGMLLLRWLIRVKGLYPLDLKHFYWDFRFTGKVFTISYPVTLWLFFSYVLIAADRFILAGYLGLQEMGRYVAFKDLVYQVIFFAGFPIFVSYQTKINDLWNARRRDEAWTTIKEALSFEILIFMVIFIIFMVIKSMLFVNILRIPEIESWIIYLPLVFAAFLWQSTLLVQRFLELFYPTLSITMALLFSIFINIALNLIFVPRFGIKASPVIMLITSFIYAMIIFSMAIFGKRRIT